MNMNDIENGIENPTYYELHANTERDIDSSITSTTQPCHTTTSTTQLRHTHITMPNVNALNAQIPLPPIASQNSHILQPHTAPHNTNMNSHDIQTHGHMYDTNIAFNSYVTGPPKYEDIFPENQDFCYESDKEAFVCDTKKIFLFIFLGFILICFLVTALMVGLPTRF